MKNIIIAILLVLVLGLGYLVLHPARTNQFLPDQQTVTSVSPAPTGETQQPAPTPSPSPTPAPATPTAVPSQYVTYARLPLLPSFIGPQEGWPPVFTYSSGAYSCTPGKGNPDMDQQTVEKTINGRTFCISSSSDGAAGTIYYTYTYTTRDTIKTDSDNGTLTTHFTLGFHDVDCTKFGTAENISCTANQPSFDVDAAVASILK